MSREYGVPERVPPKQLVRVLENARFPAMHVLLGCCENAAHWLAEADEELADRMRAVIEDVELLKSRLAAAHAALQAAVQAEDAGGKR